MAKNLTRKGIAFGALVALGTSIIAAAPAHAIDPVSLDPTAGTSYSTILGEQFSLTSLFTSAAHLGTENLKFLVTDPNAVLATNGVKVNSGAFGNEPTLDTNKQFVLDTGNNTAAPSSNVLVLKAAGTATASVTVQAFLDYNGNGVLNAGESASTPRTITWVKPASVTATTTITSAFEADTAASAKVSFDGLNNEQIDQTHVGAVFTNGDNSALGLAAAATGITAANATSTTSVTYTAANNFVVGQVVTVAGATVNTYFNATGVVTAASATQFTMTTSGLTAGNDTNAAHFNAATTVTASPVTSNVAWSSTDNFKYGLGALAALDKTKLLKVQPLYKAAGAPAATDTIGSAVTAAITARSIATFTSGIVTSNTAGVISSTNKVALNKSFQVYAKAMDGSSTPAAVAGKTVTYSVTDAALPADAAAAAAATSPATLTVNGVTYTNQAALPGATGVAKLSGVTGTDGKLVVTASATNHADANTISFAFGAENFSSTVQVRETTIALGTATITSGSASATTAGGTVAVSIKLTDIFGNAVADSYDAKAHFNSSSVGRTTANTQANDVIVPVVGGVATLNIVDNGTGVGTNSYKIQYQLRDAALGGYGANSPVDIDAAYIVNIKSAADLTPGKITLDTTGNVAAVTDSTGAAVAGQYKATAAALATADFAAYDARNPQTVSPAGFVAGLGTAQSLTATVSSASTTTYAGVEIPTARVTYALAGAQFSATLGGVEVDTLGSITVPSGTTVSLWSHVAGAQTVTVTSGAASSTVIVTFPVADTANGSAINIVAPATAAAGSTIPVVVNLVDKFGNPVLVANYASGAHPSFKLTISGIGAGASVDTTGSDALVAGTVTKYITVGAADSGTLTVTATYDKSISDTTNAVVTATATVKVGAAAVASLTSAGAQAQAQTGSAVSVSATAKDAAGAAIKGAVITFTATGAAYLSSATATTDANGVATVKLIGNVAGANSVVASANGTSAAAVNVAFGNSDASLSAAGKRVTAAWSFAAGKKVVISVNGVRVKSVVASSDAADSFSFNAKKGTNKVTVSVAGVVTDALTVKVKK